jgi:hypothetical protein
MFEHFQRSWLVFGLDDSLEIGQESISDKGDNKQDDSQNISGLFLVFDITSKVIHHDSNSDKNSNNKFGSTKLQSLVPDPGAENTYKDDSNNVAGLDHHDNWEVGDINGQDVGVSGDDDNDGACDEIGDGHFGMFFVEEGVDDPSEHPGYKGLGPDHGDGVVELDVLDLVVDLVGLFES